MTILETIIRAVQDLPLRKQVEVASYVHGLSVKVQAERAILLRRTCGALDEADGEVFETAMEEARRGAVRS